MSPHARFHARAATVICAAALIAYLVFLWTAMPATADPGSRTIKHACNYFDDTPLTGCLPFMSAWQHAENCKGNNPLCMKIDNQVLRFSAPARGGLLLACQLDESTSRHCGDYRHQYPAVAAHLRGRVVAYGDLVADLERWCTSCAGRPSSYIYSLARSATSWQRSLR